MASRRTIKRALLFIPLLAFVLADCIPYYSARLSLMLHGLPFARVVPKENRDPFQWVKTDSFASKGIVFSGRQAVGWICQPAGSFASYVPFSAQPSLTRLGNSTFRFNVPLLIAWSARWWLVPVQAITLLLWLRSREKAVRYSGR
jgi:hypothetical protein